MNNRAIGVFDSGLGGLTVLKEIHKLLPKESLIYFGDTAHVPYGTKSPQTVTKYSLAIAKFLEQEKVKLIVVACNTASALALPELQRKIKVPVIGVIDAGVRTALALTKNHNIAVLGTESTVNSHAYKEKILQHNAKAKVSETACPLFVPIVEEGLWRNCIAELAAERYMRAFHSKKADTIILGCTHYPLLKNIIKEALGKKINIVDSGAAVAKEVKEILTARKCAKLKGSPSLRFISSDSPERFKKLARTILKINVKEVELKSFFK